MLEPWFRAPVVLAVLLWWPSVLQGQTTAFGRSSPTTCAEEDNVNIPLVGPARAFVLEATHPAYVVGTDSCDPNFSSCPPGGAGYPFEPVVVTLFDDHETVVQAVRESVWWRPAGMLARVDEGTPVADAHFLRVYRRIPGTSEYPQVAVLYADGNLRLIPHPPAGVASVCFGTSVVVGPATADDRPLAEITSAQYRSGSRILAVRYGGGGTAKLALRDVDRTITRVSVTFDAPACGRPFATVRSMYVADGNSDADHVTWTDASGMAHDDPVLSFRGGDGTRWRIRRQTRSVHNTSAPDLRIEPFSYGDLDASGTVDVFDLVVLSSYLVGNAPQGAAPFTAPLSAAYLSGDGIVDVLDAVVLAGYLVGNVAGIPLP